MRERQAREQCLQGNVMSGVVVEAARAFLLCLLSLSEFLLSASNWAAAWWIVWRQATRSAARSDHCLWSMLQVVSDLFRLSLNRFFGAPLSRWPVESSPYKTIFGRRWSSILETWPAQRSWYFKIMASMLGTSACSRTSTLVMKSLQWMLRMVRRQRWWKRSSRNLSNCEIAQKKFFSGYFAIA